MSGYILTDTGAAALSAFTDERVRYAAALEDGTGFVAFNGDDADGIADGRIFHEQAFIWPFGAAAPKRGVGNGTEAFALVQLDDMDAMFAAYAGVQVSDTEMMVEGYGVKVATFLDKRLRVVAPI